MSPHRSVVNVSLSLLSSVYNFPSRLNQYVISLRDKEMLSKQLPLVTVDRAIASSPSFRERVKGFTIRGGWGWMRWMLKTVSLQTNHFTQQTLETTLNVSFVVLVFKRDLWEINVMLSWLYIWRKQCVICLDTLDTIKWTQRIGVKTLHYIIHLHRSIFETFRVEWRLNGELNVWWESNQYERKP